MTSCVVLLCLSILLLLLSVVKSEEDPFIEFDSKVLVDDAVWRVDVLASSLLPSYVTIRSVNLIPASNNSQITFNVHVTAPLSSDWSPDLFDVTADALYDATSSIATLLVHPVDSSSSLSSSPASSVSSAPSSSPSSVNSAPSSSSFSNSRPSSESLSSRLSSAYSNPGTSSSVEITSYSSSSESSHTADIPSSSSEISSASLTYPCSSCSDVSCEFYENGSDTVSVCYCTGSDGNSWVCYGSDENHISAGITTHISATCTILALFLSITGFRRSFITLLILLVALAIIPLSQSQDLSDTVVYVDIIAYVPTSVKTVCSPLFCSNYTNWTLSVFDPENTNITGNLTANISQLLGVSLSDQFQFSQNYSGQVICNDSFNASVLFSNSNTSLLFLAPYFNSSSDLECYVTVVELNLSSSHFFLHPPFIFANPQETLDSLMQNISDTAMPAFEFFYNSGLSDPELAQLEECYMLFMEAMSNTTNASAEDAQIILNLLYPHVNVTLDIGISKRLVGTLLYESVGSFMNNLVPGLVQNQFLLGRGVSLLAFGLGAASTSFFIGLPLVGIIGGGASIGLGVEAIYRAGTSIPAIISGLFSSFVVPRTMTLGNTRATITVQCNQAFTFTTPVTLSAYSYHPVLSAQPYPVPSQSYQSICTLAEQAIAIASYLTSAFDASIFAPVTQQSTELSLENSDFYFAPSSHCTFSDSSFTCHDSSPADFTLNIILQPLVTTWTTISTTVNVHEDCEEPSPSSGGSNQESQASGAWVFVGMGDCSGCDVAWTSGPAVPSASMCPGAATAVCWDAAQPHQGDPSLLGCTYKYLPTASCVDGYNPGYMYTCSS